MRTYGLMTGIALLAFALVACGQQETAPTAPSPDTTQEASVPQQESGFVVVTRPPLTQSEEEEFFGGIPPYGVLVASETEDAEAHLVFDLLQFSRSGGNLPPVQLELQQDGQYTRDGKSGVLPASEVLRIDALLDEINFFGLYPFFSSLNAESENTRYMLRVVRGGASRTIMSEEGFMPREYMILLGQLLQIGQ